MNSAKNSIHICHITSVHSAFDVRIFHKAAKTLVKAGYKVTLIAQHKKNETVDGIKIIALSKPKNRFFRIFDTTLKALYFALKQKFDVYHFHDPELIPIGLLLKIFTKAKIIYDVHEDVPKGILSREWIPKILKKPVSILVNWFEKTASQRLNYIIAATPSIKEAFLGNRVIAVRNFPVVKNSTSSYLLSKNKPGKKYFSIIYIGSISEINGITQTIRALEYLNPKFEVRIKLLGKFSPVAYKRKVKQLKGFEKVDYLGWVPLEKTPFYLAQADAGIICAPPEPNSLEAEPNKLFEYMFAGLPVIASNFPLWKKIIEGNNCGICINPLNPKEIAKAVEYLIKYPEKTRKMGENGRKAILTKYNWENEIENLLKVYKQLLKQ